MLGPSVMLAENSEGSNSNYILGLLTHRVGKNKNETRIILYTPIMFYKNT